MTWFRVDDGFSRHRKVLALRRGNERLRAIGLWTLAGSLSAEHGHGGMVPDYILEEIGASPKDVDALVRVGLWERVEDVRFHDWTVYNPDAATIAAQRVKESVSGQLGNHKRWHVTRGLIVDDCEFCHRPPDREPDQDPDRVSVGVGIGSASPVTRTRTPSGSNEPDVTSGAAIEPAERPDVERICEHLADRIEANGSKRPGITAKWRDAARLMLDRDGRTEQQVHAAIDWCQADEFWRSNILSLPKLREKYDQLRLQATRPSASHTSTDDLLARAAQRMGVGGIQ